MHPGTPNSGTPKSDGGPRRTDGRHDGAQTQDGLRSTRVIVPVKSFARAKARLSGVLDTPRRARLAELMASNVIEAASSFDVAVACDDDAVHKWALSLGAEVIRTDGHDLNGSIERATALSTSEGWERVAIVHADLPLAERLETVIAGSLEEVLAVPDRRLEGTNVLVVPTGHGFRFRFGENSFALHRASAGESGLRFRVVHDDRFSWDVDEPEDLRLRVDDRRPPRNLGEYLRHELISVERSDKT